MSVHLERCKIPEDKRCNAEETFQKHCSPGSYEMSQEEFNGAMVELGVEDFHADRHGDHGIFQRDTGSISRTAHGSLRFVRSKTRHCTDTPCLALFVVYWVGMVLLGSYAIKHGKPETLLFARDYQGNTCGMGSMAGKELIYYPEMEYDIVRFAMLTARDPTTASLANFESAGRCVASCPRKGETFELAGKSYKVYYDQKAVASRCFSRYPKSGLYFAQCARFSRNDTAGAFGAQLLDGSCADYAAEWRGAGATEARNCSALTGAWRTVTCLTKEPPCNDLSNDFYTTGRCCREAMALTYPQCPDYTLGAGAFKTNPLADNPVFQSMMSTAAWLSRAFGDMTRSAILILLCGGAFTMLQGMCWTGLVQVVARPVVITTLTLSAVTPALLAVFFYAKGGLLDGDAAWNAVLEQSGGSEYLGKKVTAYNPDLLTLEEELKVYMGLGYFMNILAVLVLAVIVNLRKFIKVAIGIIKEAAFALRCMPLMLVYPVWPISMLFLLVLYFMYVSMNLASIENVVAINAAASAANATAAQLGYGEAMPDAPVEGAGYASSLALVAGGRNTTTAPLAHLKLIFAYHLFGFLWTQQVINGIWCCTVAGAMCRWYWKFQEDKAHKKFNVMLTWKSFKKCIKFFLGSVCLGAGLIAVVMFLRLLFEYVIHAFKSYTEGKRFQGAARVIILLRVALLGLQEWIQEISVGAYIMVVMQGSHFCVGAKEASQLFKVHAKLIMTTELMATFVLMLTRLCIVGCSVLLMFGMLQSSFAPGTLGMLGLDKPHVTSPVVPLILCGIFSLAIVSCYIDILHMTIQTLLLSYAADRELNDQTGMYVMTDRLRKFLTCEKSNPPFRNVGKRFDADSVPKPREHEGLRGKAYLSARSSGQDTGPVQGLNLERQDTAKILV